MEIEVSFYSYFKDLAGCPNSRFELAPGTSIADLLSDVYQRFPRLKAMRKSTLIAVGTAYQDPSYALQAGETVSLFPPVQGG